MFCPVCHDLLGPGDVRILIFGEVCCRFCDGWTGLFEEELDWNPKIGECLADDQ